MKQPVTSKGLRVIVFVIIIGLVIVILTQKFGPYPRQMENMAAAKKHALILLPMIQKDSRFSNITADAFTGGADGSLAIFGELFSDKDLQDLKNIVESSKPPVEVVYFVKVYPAEFRQELERAKANRVSK